MYGCVVSTGIPSDGLLTRGTLHGIRDETCTTPNEDIISKGHVEQQKKKTHYNLSLRDPIAKSQSLAGTCLTACGTRI